MGELPVLAGTKPLTLRLAARIADLMERHYNGLTVTLPREYKPCDPLTLGALEDF